MTYFLPARFAALVTATLTAALALACSSTKTAAPAGCDPAQCAAKNECISDGTETKCRLPCAAQTDCPFNYACGANAAGNTFCVKLTLEIPQKPSGQWGTPCLPQGGQDGNPACDGATGFSCYGTGPTDATAYCTQYDCTAETDCAGGYTCATLNVAPNVKTAARTQGKTRSVCVKRAFCSPCAGDIDCPVLDGKQSHCIDDDTGTAKYCATPCDTSSNCRLDASCTALAEDGSRLCRPRAGVCKGDGTMCAPCRSDADCPEGLCLKAAYSPEMFCSMKSKTPCEKDGQATIVKGDCPTFTGFPGTDIGCQAATDDAAIPKDQCIGLVEFGDSGDIACYTKH